ncbi:MAG: hypothetical protein Q9218_002811 [Villophora microphyllina]
MTYIRKDKSGSSHDPHPQSSTKPEDRVFHQAFKATADLLTGSHLNLTSQNFQAAMMKGIDDVPVQQEWVEMNDLFGFLRPLIAHATVEAVCGKAFVERFPDFVENFYDFNSKATSFLYGWPAFLMPRANRGRERCIAIMREWRKTHDELNFHGNGMVLRRWSYFSKMQGMSEYGVACQDLGILWGMFSNSVPAAFWLFWHTLRDGSLLAAARDEVIACSTATQSDGKPCLDTSKLMTQSLLQSMYAEILRKYVAVYITRTTEYSDAEVLDYQIPRNRMVIINSAMAHMDERNWNTGAKGEHPVTSFWAERFLTQSTRPTLTRSNSSTDSSKSISSGTDSGYASSSDALSPVPEPTKKFLLDRYKGAWIPFDGGMHQCPGRHWVKTQILLSFAMIIKAFDMEVLDQREELRVDMGKYRLGALMPGERVRFRIRRREGVSRESDWANPDLPILPLPSPSPHSSITDMTMHHVLHNLLAALLLLFSTAAAHNINLGAHSRECFHEQLHKDDKMTVTFQVGDREFGGAGNLEIDFWIQHPRGHNIFHQRAVSSGDHSFDADADGKYLYCFSNEHWSAATKEVSFNVHGIVYVPESEAPQDPLEVEVKQLSELLSQVKDEQSYIVVRERTHRNTAESTNGRVKWWSIFQLGVLLGEGIFQVWWLKRFFEVSPSLHDGKETGLKRLY